MSKKKGNIRVSTKPNRDKQVSFLFKVIETMSAIARILSRKLRMHKQANAWFAMHLAAFLSILNYRTLSTKDMDILLEKNEMLQLINLLRALTAKSEI